MGGNNNCSLAEVVAKAGALEISRATGIMACLIHDISELHRKGMIHRRILAEDIFLDDEFKPILGPVEPGAVSLGGPGSNPNTAPPTLELKALSVPVQIEEAKKVFIDAGILLDPRQIDFYQLGTLLCLMLTGKGVAEYLRSCKIKALIPEPMQNIIDRALGLNPNVCFSSAEEFSAAIDEVSKIPMNNLPFTHLAHFEILNRIGHGGMGDVYKGYESSLDRFVAIKVLPAELCRQEDFVKRFHAEAAAIAKIDHPNVVKIFYNGEDQGYHFFAMQFVEGKTLAELIKRQGKLDVDQAITILEHCLAGVGAVHELGLIHRDVKPGNILIERNTGKALVTDFGLVKRIQSQTQMTITGMIMGTADYIAPEQARGQEIDQRADLYAIGVMMYQMLAGKLPFQADTPTAMMFQHAYEVPPPLDKLAPELPKKLTQIVMKLLEKEPADRYQKAKEVLADLHKINLANSDCLNDEPTSTPNLYNDSYERDCFGGYTPTGRFERIKNRIFDCFRRRKFLEGLATTQQQMNGAVAEYERRHKELTRLMAETKAVLSDLNRQKEQAELAVRLGAEKIESASSNEDKQQALCEKQKNEQTIAELSQLIAEQQEQTETIDLQLAKVTATLLQLRSQQNALNARLNAANINLTENDHVQGSSLVTKVYCIALVVLMVGLGSYLAYTLLSTSSLENAVIARWTFDEGQGNIAHDMTGKNHGKIFGATWTDGKFGKALNFDGVDDYVDCGNDAIFDMNGKSFTISAWVKTDDDRGGIISKHAGGENGEWLFGASLSGGPGKLIFGGSQFEKLTFAPHRINDKQWHHVVGVMVHKSENKNDLYEYIDGELDCAMMNIPDINHGSLHVLMGDENNHQWPLRGVVDDVCIFNRALSAKEIQLLNKEGLPSKNLVLTETSTTNNSGLIAYWTFDEGNGTIIHDMTGENDGTIHGARWINRPNGSALLFNGENNFIETQLKIDENGKDDWTFVTWVYPTALATDKQHCARQQVICTDNQGFDWSILEALGNWQIFTGKTFWNSGIQVDLNQWQHLAVVFKAGEDTILYKNGNAKASGIIPDSDGSCGPVRIGNSCGGWNEAFKGMIGKTMIFKRALSSEEINNMYLNESAKMSFSSTQRTDLLGWGLIGYWSFDEGTGETTRDLVAGNTGEIHGAQWTEGKIGGALEFDGIDDSVRTSLRIGQDGSTDVTFAAWVYPTKHATESNHWKRMQVMSVDAGYANWSLLQENDHWAIFPGWKSWVSPAKVELNQWQHVAVTFRTGRTVIFYLNGVPYTTKLISTSAFRVNNLWIGENPGPWNEAFAGKIDDVRVYDRALSTDEIQGLYRSTVTAAPFNVASSIQNNRIIDRVSYPFRNDPQVIGKWESVDFVSCIEDFIPGKKSFSGNLFLKEIEFFKNGRTSLPTCTWTRDLFLNTSDYTASRYCIKRYSEDNSQLLVTATVLSPPIVPELTELLKSAQTSHIAEILGHIGDARAIEPLILKLESSPGEPLRSTILESLRLLTQKDCGSDAGAWRKWWMQEGSKAPLTAVGPLNDGKNIDVVGFMNQLKNLPENLSPKQDLYIFLEWKSGDYGNQHAKPHYYVLKKVQSQNADPNPEGLLAWWNFDQENGNIAWDTTGRYKAMLQGAQWTDGINGKALLFDGEDDFADTDLKIPSDGSTDITMAAWIYPVRFAPEENLFRLSQILCTDDGKGWDWSIHLCQSRYQVWSGMHCWDAPCNGYLNQWQHVAVVYKIGKGTIFYLNGKPYPICCVPISDFTSRPLRIGNIATQFKENFTGKIDEVKIYARALSTQEIMMLCRKTSPGPIRR